VSGVEAVTKAIVVLFVIVGPVISEATLSKYKVRPEMFPAGPV
jgi:hypothetical protein